MFVPPHFAESDTDPLHGFIERHSFGLLVSQVGGEPFATHPPLLLDRTAGPHGALLGHLARANPHWHELAGRTALAAFTGPHAYVSPPWYGAENVVPTWNYAAVHAYGTAQLVEGRGALLDIVRRSVIVYEAAMPRPWALGGPSAAVDRPLGQIVGGRIPIERSEGKWRLGPNHPAGRRQKVIAALRQRGGENAVAVAVMMQATLPPEG